MSPHLIKKLKQYSTLVAPAITMAGISNAQVIYTDVNPDKEIIGSPGNPHGALIDMDNNGSFEFVLSLFQSFELSNGEKINLAGAGLYSDNGAGIMGYTNHLGSKIFYYPSALQPNVTIDGNAHFRNIFGQYGTLAWSYINGNGTFGKWTNITDGFMGVSLKDSSGATHYGWVRMDISINPPKIILKDYAYQATAGQSILAGEGGLTSVEPVIENDGIVIFSSNKQVIIQSSHDDHQPMKISVLDMMGKEIKSETSTQNSVVLTLRNVAAGIYMVQVIKDGKMKTKKISLQ